MTRWDDGVVWFTRRTVAPSVLPLELPYVRDLVLRVTNGSAEDPLIESLILASAQAAEQATGRALMAQTWELCLSGFPACEIELPRPPLMAVTGITYYDADDVQHTWGGSPLPYDVVSSGTYSKAKIRPVSGTTFPDSGCRTDAVTVTFTAGYTGESGPELELIKTGMTLMIAELYKQRSISVVGTSVVKAPLDLSTFWRPVA